MAMLDFFKRNKGQMEVTISNRTVIRVVAVVLASLLLVEGVRRASHPLTLIFIAFFLTLALNAPVHWLAQRIPGKRRGSRTLATASSFIIIIALLAGFLLSIVPPIVRQTGTFIHQAPQLVEDVHDQNSSVGQFVRRYKLEDKVNNFSGQLSDRLLRLSNTSVSTFTRVTSSIFSVLTVLVLTFMMLTEGPHWLNMAKRLIPDEHEPHVEALTSDMYGVVRGYVNGQLLLAALASVLIVIPLIALGVSYPIALMFVIFICGLIPLVGHTIGAIIVSTIALFHSPAAAVIVLTYYILYQQIENYVIQPRLQASHTDMSPLLVFTSVIIGVSFGGLIGGLVAIPLAGCLRILLVDYLETKKLIEPLPTTETK